MSGKKFEAKWQKHLPPGFEDAVGTMGDAEMEEVLVMCEKNIHITEKEKGADPTLNGAKDLIKDKNLFYNAILNCQKGKIKFIIHTMEERGKVSDEVDDTLPSTPDAADGSDGN
jgi:hypothetical protein